MGSAKLFFCFIITFSIYLVERGATARIICPFQSLYQFGDSISDTGNLVRVLPVGPFLPAARLPYGETFPGSPTGRWSDGRLIVDFAAMALGLPLLNPYLDKNASFENGVNFAVAGSTALNFSFFTARGIMVPPTVAPLHVQLNWFRTYLTSICSTPPECADKLRMALIFVGEIGGNDINYPLAQGKSLEEIQTYVPFINEAIINATREIILIGARQVVVPGNFPVGCIPFALRAFASNDSRAYDEFGCIKSLNNLATFQNNNLQVALRSLRKEFPNVTIIYADYYNAFLTLLRPPLILGFDPRTLFEPCCRSGEFNPVSPQFCGNSDVPLCQYPDRYIHWDGLHLTEKAYSRIQKSFFKSIIFRIKCLEI